MLGWPHTANINLPRVTYDAELTCPALLSPSALPKAALPDVPLSGVSQAEWLPVLAVLWGALLSWGRGLLNVAGPAMAAWCSLRSEPRPNMLCCWPPAGRHAQLSTMLHHISKYLGGRRRGLQEIGRPISLPVDPKDNDGSLSL